MLLIGLRLIIILHRQLQQVIILRIVKGGDNSTRFFDFIACSSCSLGEPETA